LNKLAHKRKGKKKPAKKTESVTFIERSGLHRGLDIIYMWGDKLNSELYRMISMN